MVGKTEATEAFQDGYASGLRNGRKEGVATRFRPLEEELLIAMVRNCGSFPEDDVAVVAGAACGLAAALRRRMEGEG